MGSGPRFVVNILGDFGHALVLPKPEERVGHQGLLPRVVVGLEWALGPLWLCGAGALLPPGG